MGDTVRRGLRLAVAGSACALFVSLLVGGAGCSEPVAQPLEFSHKVHVVDQEFECIECHKFNRTHTYSGMPTVEDCLECHDEALTESPEEAKLLAAAESGAPLVWGRLYALPEHVYYSHRRHVVLAELDCATCHGDIGVSAAPPPEAPTEITMGFCEDCHERSGVTTDCIACHR